MVTTSTNLPPRPTLKRSATAVTGGGYSVRARALPSYSNCLRNSDFAVAQFQGGSSQRVVSDWGRRACRRAAAQGCVKSAARQARGCVTCLCAPVYLRHKSTCARAGWHRHLYEAQHAIQYSIMRQSSLVDEQKSTSLNDQMRATLVDWLAQVRYTRVARRACCAGLPAHASIARNIPSCRAID